MEQKVRSFLEAVLENILKDKAELTAYVLILLNRKLQGKPNVVV